MAIKVQAEVDVTPPKLDQSIGAFKALQQEIKAAKNELAGLEQGSEAFNQTAARVGKLNNQMQDLQKTIAQTSGAPLENLNSSFSVLGSKIKNLDVDGASQAFSTLWSTIAANPLTALAAALALVYTNWDSIKEVLGLTTPKIEDNTAAIKANDKALKDSQAAQDQYIQFLNDQIELLSLTNAPLAEILNAIETRTKAQVSAIDKEIEAKNKLIESTKQEIAANEATLRAAQLRGAGINQATLNQVEFEKQALEEKLAVIEKEKAGLEGLALRRDLIIARGTKAEKDAIKERETVIKEETTIIEQSLLDRLQARIDSEIAREALFGETVIPEIQANADAVVEIQTEADRQLVESAKKTQDEIDKRKRESAALNEFLDKQVLKSAIDLNELVFQARVAGLQKGSAAEQQAAKNAFNLNKALQLAVATNDGIKSVIGAFATSTSQGGPILGAAYALAAGLTSAVQIAKIANSQFNPKGNSTPVSGGSFTQPAPTIVAPPAVTPTPQAPITNLNPDGTVQGSQRVWVSTNDIKDSLNEVEVLENRAAY